MTDAKVTTLKAEVLRTGVPDAKVTTLKVEALVALAPPPRNKLVDLARMTTTTTGTGTMTLAAASGFKTFAQAGVVDGQTVSYAIEDGTNREVGRGVYSSVGPSLTRTVIASTNSDAKIALSGSASVAVAILAEDHKLGELNDVSVASAAAGDLLKFDGTQWTFGQAALTTATDVAVVTPADKDLLRYSASTGKWANDPGMDLVRGTTQGPGYVSSRYWRLANMTAPGANVSMNEVEFHATTGGAAIAGATWTASTTWDGSMVASNLGDGNYSTSWASTESGGAGTTWVKAVFAAAITPVEIKIWPRGGGYTNQTPTSIALQYSADGTTWTTIQTITTASWTAGVPQAFAISKVAGFGPVGLKTTELLDVATTTPTNGQTLVYNSTTSKYAPGTVSGLPAGGAAGQVLTKNSATDGDAGWATASGGGGGGSYAGSILAKDRFAPPLVADFPTLLGTNSTNPNLTFDSETGLYLGFGLSPAGGDNVRLAMRSIPSGNYTIVTRMRGMTHGAIQYNWTGMVLRNSTNNKLIVFGINATGVEVLRYSSQTAWNATPWKGDVPINQPEWFKIAYDGTYINFYVSTNGKNWVAIWRETPATWITPDQVGFGVMVNHTGNWVNAADSVNEIGLNILYYDDGNVLASSRAAATVALPLGATSHRYWRLTDIVSQGVRDTSSPTATQMQAICAELEMRATVGGTAQTPTGSSAFGGLTPSGLYDGDTATNAWTQAYSSSGAYMVPTSITYDLGSAVYVRELKIWKAAGVGTASQGIVDFRLWWSDDGVRYIEAGRYAPAWTWTDANEGKTVTVM